MMRGVMDDEKTGKPVPVSDASDMQVGTEFYWWLVSGNE